MRRFHYSDGKAVQDKNMVEMLPSTISLQCTIVTFSVKMERLEAWQIFLETFGRYLLGLIDVTEFIVIFLPFCQFS